MRVIFLSLEGIFLSHALTDGCKTRSFAFSPKDGDRNKPKLVLIAGCPGTGKSTFGMAVALDQGIIKCMSTDTVRAVMRSLLHTCC
jgi:2-phosphoglycerate kinase